jgi:FMN phosphatase YigB (HAD superfamily)
MKTIESCLRDLYARYGSVEYFDVWLEADFQGRLGVDVEVLASARAIQIATANAALHPYTGVVEGLTRLRLLGIKLVCLSDARLGDVTARLKWLGLASFFDAIYAQPEPDSTHENSTRKQDLVEFSLLYPEVTLSMSAVGIRKPDPELFRTILEAHSVKAGETVIFGDNLAKDVGFAQATGAFDCWARYGTLTEPVDADLLLNVTNWGPEASARFRHPTPVGFGVQPSVSFDSFPQFCSWVDDEWPTAAKFRPPAAFAEQLSMIEISRNWKNFEFAETPL